MKVDGSAQHLLNIINDILDMSRIESGRIAIKNEEFPFAREIEQVNSMIGSQCKEKGLDYEFRVIGKTDDYYVGDGIRMPEMDGLDAHLSKPVEPETLFGTLRDLMGKRQDPEK